MNSIINIVPITNFEDSSSVQQLRAHHPVTLADPKPSYSTMEQPTNPSPFNFGSSGTKTSLCANMHFTPTGSRSPAPSPPNSSPLGALRRSSPFQTQRALQHSFTPSPSSSSTSSPSFASTSFTSFTSSTASYQAPFHLHPSSLSSTTATPAITCTSAHYPSVNTPTTTLNVTTSGFLPTTPPSTPEGLPHHLQASAASIPASATVSLPYQFNTPTTNNNTTNNNSNNNKNNSNNSPYALSIKNTELKEPIERKVSNLLTLELNYPINGVSPVPFHLQSPPSHFYKHDRFDVMIPTPNDPDTLVDLSLTVGYYFDNVDIFIPLNKCANCVEEDTKGEISQRSFTPGVVSTQSFLLVDAERIVWNDGKAYIPFTIYCSPTHHQMKTELDLAVDVNYMGNNSNNTKSGGGQPSNYENRSEMNITVPRTYIPLSCRPSPKKRNRSASDTDRQTSPMTISIDDPMSPPEEQFQTRSRSNSSPASFGF